MYPPKTLSLVIVFTCFGNLLQLTHLYELACTKIAAFMKGKSPEEVNKEFTIDYEQAIADGYTPCGICKP